MRLSKNFTLKELTHSNTAVRLGIENNPDKEGIWNLTLLATELLQPIRDRIGALRVTSGYRSPELNAIFGANRSQHMLCEAVDLQYVRRGVMDNLKIYQAIIDLDLDFDQMILEFGDSTMYNDPMRPAWIHISWTVRENRNQVLVAYKDENNKTKYRPINNLNSL